MQKIDFKNLPDTSTPFTAENFNQLQTNVENAINEILESGNSGNQYWEKYSDGTLIQWGYISWPWVTFSASGNIYRSDLVSLSLPQAFTENTLLMGYCSFQSVAESGGLYWNQSTYLKDVSTVEGYFMKSTSGNSDIYARYFAIGRWK